MRSQWSDAESREFVDQYGGTHGEDVALRVYTSRLIGREEDLVLHGGGNTSVKTRVKNVLGEETDVLCIKGSGWNLASIEPAGLPAVEMNPLLRLLSLDRLSDEDMVNQVRGRLLDAKAPTPSVETLLHAFLPHRFVDHTHADAILVLTNQPDGEALVGRALGDDIAVLPWIMPGFPLAKAVADAYQRNPDCQGIVLLKHGLFTFGDDARSSYERMIDLVDRAERFITERIGDKPTMTAPAQPIDADAVRRLAEDAMPVVRGAFAMEVHGKYGQEYRRMVGDWRGAEDLVAFSLHPDCRTMVELGPLTPDHVIRTKGRCLFLQPEQATDPAACRQAVADYVSGYQEYFRKGEERRGCELRMLDPFPLVAIVPGAGALCFGRNKKAASVAADITEHTLRSKAQSHALGTYDELPPDELFEMEYWSLEQAKLGTKAEPLLAGQVALITGAGGAIGCGIADALLAAGAHVVVTDANAENLERVHTRLSASHPQANQHHRSMDVTDADEVEATFRECCRIFGGVDILVPNAGIAHVSDIADMDEAKFQQVLNVNLTGTMHVLKSAARIFELQGTGGSVIIQASKNVFAPGKSFGAYSASKAGALQLGRVAALELARLGVRVNMINADAVFGDDDMPSGLWQEVGPERMKSRNLDPAGLKEHYREQSLLKVPVLPAHVGEAVVFFAAGRTPTTGATLPVDGGIPGAFPR